MKKEGERERGRIEEEKKFWWGRRRAAFRKLPCAGQ